MTATADLTPCDGCNKDHQNDDGKHNCLKCGGSGFLTVQRLIQCLAEALNEDGQPRFPGFRQDCSEQWVRTDNGCWQRMKTAKDQYLTGYKWSKTHPATHCPCNGTGWLARAGGLEGGLAGLDKKAAGTVLMQLHNWVFDGIGRVDVPMPSAPEILAEGLRLVIEIAGLEVPHGS